MKFLYFFIIAVLLLSAVGCAAANTEQPAPTTTTTVVTTPTTAATTAPEAQIGWVTADSLRVRTGPGTDYHSDGGTKYGEMVTILGKEGDWYKIARPTALGYGYVSAQFISFTDPALTTTTTAADTTSATAATTTVAP